MGILVSLVVITLCAGLGACAAWLAISWLGVTGIAGALLMIGIGMVGATLLFTAVVAVGRILHLIR